MSANDKADAAWYDYINQQQEEKIQELERELNAANDRIKRLEEAGDALLELCEADESKFHLADHIDARCDAWRKSKEAKL